MDDSFQFIIESPQHTQGHKKRPRLVTSCDNCRLKKIKCLQPSPETKCEACKAAKIPCRFRDRERYFAERSRAIAGPNVGGTYGDDQRSESSPSLDAYSVASSSSSPSISSHSSSRSPSTSPQPSGVVLPDGEHGRFQAYVPPDSRRGGDSHRHGSSLSSFPPSRNDPMGYNLPPAQLLHSRSSSPQNGRPIHLFDPENPQRPHPSLMSHFIQLFFQQLGNEYYFLSYDEISSKFWDGSLSPLLASSIATMASRYSSMPELTVRGLHNVSEAYCENAKALLAGVTHIPTMDTTHALILLAWSEYKNNRIPGFRTYYPMAMRMGMDLGLSDPSSVQMASSERERNRRRSTWANILTLHSTSASIP